MRHFDTAAAEREQEHAQRRRDSSSSSKLVNSAALPDDVLLRVMHHVDGQTWRAMAKALPACAPYGRTHVRFDIDGNVCLGKGDDLLVVAGARAVTYVGKGSCVMSGYEVTGYRGFVSGGGVSNDIASNGSSSYSLPRARDRSKRQKIAAHVDAGADEEAGMTWLLLAEAELDDVNRAWSVMAARFPPVVGMAGRQSLLAEVPGMLVRVSKHELQHHTEAI
jgi:hypothetical protein